MKSRISIAALAAIVFSVFVTLQPSYTAAQSADDNTICKPVKSIFARGSGQTLVDNEYSRFEGQLRKKLPEALVTYYELGTEPQDTHQYPAITVGEFWRNGNLIGAGLSGGMGNDYGRSVKEGVLELDSYLESTLAACPSTVFILGGYSQGAQVIGQTLPGLSSEIQSKIVFSGLFGDPKLNLPEGRGFIPPACLGKELSAYRRDIANCDVDRGSLGLRSPYLPSGLETKTGLWCYANDFICGATRNPFNNSGHGLYGDEGMAIDKAVTEAVSRLRLALPKDVADTIPTEDTTSVDTNVDVVYVLDTTGSMSGKIADAKQFAANSAANIITKNGRVALVAYKDVGDSYTARVVSGFSSDPQQFQTALDALYAEGGGDEPEALLHALMTAFNELDWQNGATKAAVVLTDASFHNPDLVDGSTLADVVQRSLEIDPVNVYAIVPDYIRDLYEEIANQTAGQVIIDSGDTVAALTTVLSKIKTRPVVTLPIGAYRSEIGQAITFSTTVTVPTEVTITSYDWDFDGDGVFDQTTDTPVVQHAYDTMFDGSMQVKVTASNGTVGSTSAKVSVGITQTITIPESPTDLTVKIISTKDHKSTVSLKWKLPAHLPDHYVLTLNGIGLGILTSDRTSVEIYDIDRTIVNEVGIIGATSDGTEGDINTAQIEQETPPTDTTDTPTKHKRPLLFWIFTLVMKALTRALFTWMPQHYYTHTQPVIPDYLEFLHFY